MQLHKFHGSTLKGALARVRRTLGDDALIVETRTLAPDSPEARLNPGARYEIQAVREAPAANPRIGQAGGLLDDLAALRSQIRDLLEDGADEDRLLRARVDLKEHQRLMDIGVDREILAPHFRSWLNWRTASPAVRSYLAQDSKSVASRMTGDTVTEWLWLTWCDGQALSASPSWTSPRVVGLLGGTGVGKTTTLAKLASINRQNSRQNNGILVTLDTRRFGAVEHSRRLAKLLGVTLHEVTTQEELMLSMQTWASRDWVGIDTPGGMNGDSPSGRLYGSVLAQTADVQSLLVMPANTNAADGKEQMARARRFGAQRVLFTKLDETTRQGSMVNLTMDGQWKIAGTTAGQRVPDDWQPISPEFLRDRVLGAAATEAA